MKKRVVAVVIISLWCMLIAFPVHAGPAMDRIIKKGELVVGTSGTQPPMTATTKKGTIIGMDADIAKAMAAAMGVEIKFMPMPFAKLLPSLVDGKVDMVISGMTITPKRNQQVAYIGPYYVSGKGILAVAEKYAALKEAKGLNNAAVTIAALKSSTSQTFAEEMMPQANLKLTKSLDEATKMLLDGEVDVVVADFPFCAYTAYRHSEKGLAAGQSPLTFEPLGIAVREDALLMNWIQNFMIRLQGTGELKKIQSKWLNGGAWIDELP